MSVAYKGMVMDKTKETFKPNPKSLDGVPDLCMLTYLAEDNVLYNLGFRYKKNEVYTSTTAKVLVAVNPYERMDKIYTDEMMKAYQNAPMNLEGLATAGDLPPHVFTVANAAFNNLVAWKRNQSIIVCGESGSGKTESAKYMMRFLAYTTTSTSVDPGEFEEANKVGQQILDANPILESFGNAKTLLNNNSSRFGKFTKMLFQETKVQAGQKARRKLVGAMIEVYLLEKSRVVRQDKGERNFHIFYQVTSLHARKDFDYLNLKPAEEFHYVNQSGVNTLDDLRFPGKAADVEWNAELEGAYKTLQIPIEQQKNIYKIVSGVLHLGNINFTQLKGEGSDIANPDQLKQTAAMFDLEEKDFALRLQTRSVPLPGGKIIVKPLNEPDAVFNRDSVARNIYNGLFRWIVWRINEKSNTGEKDGISWIGILDVFGFEIFENNSFEQFCINFANERLQQYFNEHVLKAEQDLYKKEALLWDPIDLPDNQDCIDLVMSKPYGILPILDSTCVQPQGTHEVFTANLFKAHKYHPRLRQMKQRKRSDSDKQYESFNGFTIRHYAGTVIYDCEKFLEKNADASEFDTLELFLSSKNEIAAKVLRMKADGSLEDSKRGFARAFRSTGTVFSEQLSELMATLRKTAPYFVRCIKPNNSKAPRNFVDEYVRPQLRCGGLIEALRIIKLGFPTRCHYTRIHELFGSILKAKPVVNLNLRDFAEALMNVVGDSSMRPTRQEYQLGLTMVFFRPGKQQFLTDILEKKPETVTADQVKAIRKFLIKKRWIRARGTVRGWLRAGKMLNEMRFKKAAITMVLVYRTVGRVLKKARRAIGMKDEEENSRRLERDLAYQKALKDAEALKQLTEQKAKMEAEWARKEAEAKRILEATQGELEASQAKQADLHAQLKNLKEQLADSDSKRLQLMNTSKTQVMELQNKLLEEKNQTALLKREQAAAQQSIQEYEDKLQKNRIAIEDLRKSLGLGKQEYEAQIQDKDRLIAELRERIRKLEEQLSELKESTDRTIRELQDQLEQARNEAREEKNRLEATIRERDATISRLQGDLALLKETSETNIRQLSENLDATKEELKLTREKLTRALEGKETELNDTKRELALTIGKLEAATAGQAEATKNAESTKAESEEKLAELKDKSEKAIKKLEQKLTEVQSQLAIANDRLENVKKEQEAYKAQSEDARAALESQLREKEGEVNDLREELKRTQAKLEALQAQFGDKTSALQDELNRARADARDQQARFDKDLWEKNSELSSAKSELALIKDRLTADKERAENALASTQAALEQEKKLGAERQAKFSSELSAKAADLKDAKAELKAEKAEWRVKQEKYDKQILQLESEIDQLQDELNTKNSKESLADKEKKGLSDEADAAFARKEARLNAQIEELRQDVKDLEEQAAKAREEKTKALSELDLERDSWRDSEARYKEELTRANAEIDKIEKQFIQFRQQQGDDMEQKMQALSGQVTLLQSLTDDLKAEKQDSKEREAALSEQLKEALGQLAETRSELKHLQSAVGTERDKLRIEIDNVREKHLAESQGWKEQASSYERKLGEKTALIAELKSELQESTEREAKISAELQESESDTKDELRKLKAQVDELSSEQKDWFEKQRDYEAKLGKAAKDLAEAQAALSDIEHKRKSADGNRTELEVLKAKLAASEKLVAEKAKSADKQVQLVREELQAEIEELKKDHERDLAKRDQDQKTQGEAYKYKLQYLELSQKELQSERKKWQEKEREYEKAVVSITTELRELKLEHQQAVDLHEAFKAHVEAKESARTQESSNWDIKKQAMAAEHQLGLRQSETAKNGKIAQLEREVAKLKIELEDAQEEVERLTLALEGSERGVDSSKAASS